MKTLLIVLAGLIVFGAIIGLAYGLGSRNKETTKEATFVGAMTGAGCFFWIAGIVIIIGIYILLFRSCSA